MLKNLLNTEVVQVVEQAKDWREAVAISCRPLIENGSIEPRYVDAIYRSHDTIGPYYVVGPGIAMPHARPEEGANKLSLALTLIPSGVNFDADENDPVKFFDGQNDAGHFVCYCALLIQRNIYENYSGLR